MVTPKGWDIVVEAGGSPGGFEIARRATSPRGTIILKSTFAGNMEVHMPSIVVKEFTLIDSRCGPFEPALRFLKNNLVDPSPMIEATYRLTQGIEAFEHAARPGVFKVFLKPES